MSALQSLQSSSRSLRWGFIGTGQIAKAMAQQLIRLGARKEAICSGSGKPVESIERARMEYGFARSLSLEQLVADPSIDVVYVASANTSHFEHALLALRGGKPVLCEKPLTLNAADAETLFREAERRKLLLVDGAFSACLPAFDVVRGHLPRIGPIRYVELNKKIRLSIMKTSPIINSRALGGGLFDGCGSYTTHALCVIFGAKAVASLRNEDIVEVVSVPGPSNEVDWDTTVKMRLCGAEVVLTHRAQDHIKPSIVRGSNGCIEFTLPRLPDVAVDGKVVKTPYGTSEQGPFKDVPDGEPSAPLGLHVGLGVEAYAVQRALIAGADGPGTPELPLDVMRAMAHAMDLIRHRIPTHLHYQGPEFNREKSKL